MIYRRRPSLKVVSLLLAIPSLALQASIVASRNLEVELGPARETDDPASTAKSKQPLVLPEWWDPGDPLPRETTNCVRCHLTAGRELTAAVRDFAGSVHDRAPFSCHDCHGGNTDDDATAHEHEFNFIGTKLSAHMEACADCHTEEAEVWRKGPHYWDLAQRINRDYPMCVDCHGNHDVGKPPAEFRLMNVCTDCHKKFAEQFSGSALIVAENDRLWQVLRRVAARRRQHADPIPVRLRRELAALRYTTARLMHAAATPTTEQAAALAQRTTRLSTELEAWLKQVEPKEAGRATDH